MSCYCDFEQPSFFTQTWRTAKKEHKCCECGRPIRPGDEYEYVSGLWEGRIDVFKSCETCADLRDALTAVTCVSYRGLKEEYWEYLDQVCDSTLRARTYRHVFPPPEKRHE